MLSTSCSGPGFGLVPLLLQVPALVLIVLDLIPTSIAPSPSPNACPSVRPHIGLPNPNNFKTMA